VEELEAGESIVRLSRASERYLGVQVSTVHRDGTTLFIDPVDTAEFWDLREKRKVTLPGGAGSAILSRDGRAVVTGTRDGRIVVVDPASGKESGSLKTSRNGTVVVGVSSDGKRVLSSDTTEEATRVRVWNIETGTKENSFAGARVRRISEDQTILEVGSTIKVLDLKENRIESSVEIPGALSFTFLGTRPLALRKAGRRVEIVDLQSGKSVVSFEIPSAPGGYIQALSSCRCGNHVLTFGADGSARLREIPGGKESAVLRDPAWSPTPPVAFAFAVDDLHYLLVRRQKTVRILSFADGEEVFSVVPHAGEHLPTFEVSPDGKTFITWIHDELKIWDTRTHRPVRVLPGRFQKVLFCPEGCALLLGDRKKVSVFDVVEGKTLVEAEVDFEVTGLSADHRFLFGWSENLSVVGKERFQLIKYDLQSKAVTATLNSEDYPLRQYLSRDGAHLLSHEGWGVRIYQVDPFRLLGRVTRRSSALTSFVGKDKYFCTTEETEPAFAVWKLKR
jgi:WD40 repeat protein